MQTADAKPMTAEPDLLPLPSVLLNWPHPTNHAAIRDYARANLAELQREVEALRAEVAEWKRVASAQAELHGDAEARAERLAEALRKARARIDHVVHGDAGMETLLEVYDLMTAALDPTAAQENDDA